MDPILTTSASMDRTQQQKCMYRHPMRRGKEKSFSAMKGSSRVETSILISLLSTSRHPFGGIIDPLYAPLVVAGDAHSLTGQPYGNK